MHLAYSAILKNERYNCNAQIQKKGFCLDYKLSLYLVQE